MFRTLSLHPCHACLFGRPGLKKCTSACSLQFEVKKRLFPPCFGRSAELNLPFRGHRGRYSDCVDYPYQNDQQCTAEAHVQECNGRVEIRPGWQHSWQIGFTFQTTVYEHFLAAPSTWLLSILFVCFLHRQLLVNLFESPSLHSHFSLHFHTYKSTFL